MIVVNFGPLFSHLPVNVLCDQHNTVSRKITCHLSALCTSFFRINYYLPVRSDTGIDFLVPLRDMPGIGTRLIQNKEKATDLQI